MSPSAPGPRWIFGYGSLVWRPDFPHAERVPARIHGWKRRFWQGSTDHRGVPGAPGRVVTLLPAAGEVCCGVAYRLSDEQAPAVMAHLDHREQGGYDRVEVRIELDRGDAVNGLVYRATPDNENYLGPAPIARIAEQVRRSHGPSGANAEYVLRLAGALREMQRDDPHVSALAALVRDPS